MTSRILASILIIIAILVLPYWLYVPLLFIAVIIYPFFWEGILLGFFVEVVHGGVVEYFSLFGSTLAWSILILLIVLLPLRERLRSYV